MSTHEDVEEDARENFDWPLYYVSGEEFEEEFLVPAYLRVEGPNGPVSYINPGGDPQPTTMHSLAMAAQSDDFRLCSEEETPWGEER